MLATLEKVVSTGWEEPNILLGHFWNRQIGASCINQQISKQAIPMIGNTGKLTNIESYAKDTTKEWKKTEAKLQ